MKIIVADVETTPIQKFGKTDKMWLFGGKDVDTGEVEVFFPYRGQDEIDKAIAWANTVDLWIGHNFLEFDLVEISKHIKHKLIDPDKVLDTLVVSRLLYYDRPVPPGAKSAHSLDAWGRRLGVHKGEFNKFSEYSEEMYEYWRGDLETTEALYKHLLKYTNDPSWAMSIWVEHQVQIELTRQKAWGFPFDKKRAEGLLAAVKKHMADVEERIEESYPPKLKLVNTLKYRKTKDGEEYATVQKAKENHALTKVDGDTLYCYNYIPFNPGSPVDRIDVLWEAGWKPFDKTKTHQQFLRKKVGQPYGKTVKRMTQEFYDSKLEHLEKYGWKVNEDNLETLPEDAPEGARLLAQWLTLEGRRSSLVEWIGQVQDDGRIHGSTSGIGAWTGRCSHKAPNTANISSVWPKDKKPRNSVEYIKSLYDTHMRECWTAPENGWLVGVDADGIQLRILADQLWRHCDASEYAEAIMKGRKEDETDIHNMNRKALNLEHITRDDSKTFIYAWILNAGIPKVASILKTNQRVASEARDNFESSINGLKQFKREFLPMVADNGWFTGYDGRKVVVPNLHKTLAGILQNGEAVVMKHAMIKWHKDLRGDGIRYSPASFVHDEFQTCVYGSKEEAEHVKEVQMNAITWAGKELGFRIATPGSGSIGRNWGDTH